MLAALADGGAAPAVSYWLPALMIAVGIVGIVVPVLPGLLLAVGGVLVWALMVRSGLAWTVLAACVVLYAAALTAQVLVPGRRLRRQGVTTWTLVLAGIAGIMGFFVVPVVGLPLFFVAAIWVVELLRHRDPAVAWRRTKHALVAVLQSMGIELATGLLIAFVWGGAAIATWRSST